MHKDDYKGSDEDEDEFIGYQGYHQGGEEISDEESSEEEGQTHFLLDKWNKMKRDYRFTFISLSDCQLVTISPEDWIIRSSQPISAP